jgi:hypothetical protein
VIVGIVGNYLFNGNSLGDVAGLTIIVVLCTFRPRPVFQTSPLGKRQRQSVMERASQDSVALDPPSLA